MLSPTSNRSYSSKFSIKDSSSLGTSSNSKPLFIDKIVRDYDQQEELIDEYNLSQVSEPVTVEEVIEEVVVAVNTPKVDSEGRLSWIAYAEDSVEFDKAYYFAQSGSVSKEEQVQLNEYLNVSTRINLDNIDPNKHKNRGIVRAIEYINSRGLDIDLLDYIEATNIKPIKQ